MSEKPAKVEPKEDCDESSLQLSNRSDLTSADAVSDASSTKRAYGEAKSTGSSSRLDKRRFPKRLRPIAKALLGLGAVVGPVLGVYNCFDGARRTAITNRIQADQWLADAKDLLGGAKGTTYIREYTEDEHQKELARRLIEKAHRLDQYNPVVYRMQSGYYDATERPEEALNSLRQAAEFDGDYISLGRALETRHRLAEAESVFRRAASSLGVEGYVGLGEFLRRQGRIPEAREVYLRALDLVKGSRTARRVAHALVDVGESRRAEELLERITHSEGHELLAYADLASLQAARGAYTIADETYRRSIERNPGSARAHVQYALFLGERARFYESEDELRKAIRINPVEPGAHLEMGELLLRRLELGRAESHFRRASEVSNTEIAYYRLADTLSLQRRFDEAEAVHRHLVDEDPTDTNRLINLASFLNVRGRQDEAEEVLLSATQTSSPENAYQFLGELLLRQGRREEAKAAFRNAVSANPGLYWNEVRLLRLEASEGSGQPVEEYLKNALETDPESLYLWSELCDILGEEGTTEETLRHLELMLTSDKSCFAYYHVSDVYLGLERPSAAEAILRAGVEENPGDPECHLRLGKWLQKEERLEEAKAFMRRAVALRPASAHYHLALADILRDEGELEEAERIYRRIIDSWPGYMMPYDRLIEILEERDRGQDVGIVRAEARNVRDVLGLR